MSRPPSGVQLTLPSIPIDEGSRPASRAPSSTIAFASSRRGPGGTIGNHPSPSRPARRNAGGVDAPNQIGIGRCTGRGAIPAPLTCSERPSNVTERSVNSRRRSSICSALRAPRSPKLRAERVVLHRVPADADAESEAAFAQDVDLGRLLRHERGLPLREDDHAGDQLELRDAGEEAEQHERLVERRVDVVGAGPTVVHRGVGAEHVVVREEVRVSERFDPCAVRPHRAHVRADLGLREHHADLHRLGLSRIGPVVTRAATEGTPMRHRHVHRPSPAPLDARRSLVARGRRRGACRPASVRRRVRVRRARAPLPAALLRVAEATVGRGSVAQEVTQDTWLAVFRGIDRFEGRSSFKSWLFSILLNRARSAARREGPSGSP